MSTDNYGRRTWNKDEYAKMAKAREAAERAAAKDKKPFDLYKAKEEKTKDEER